MLREAWQAEKVPLHCWCTRSIVLHTQSLPGPGRIGIYTLMRPKPVSPDCVVPEEGAGRLREGPGMLAVVERAGEPGSHADEDIRAHTERVAAPAVALDTVTCTTAVINTSGRGIYHRILWCTCIDTTSSRPPGQIQTSNGHQGIIFYTKVSDHVPNA